MLVHIQARHFSLSEGLNKYVKSKMKVMLSRHEENIIRIDVSLFDVNGPKGGEDKCCKIIIKVNGCSTIVVQETAEDLYDAINTCARRAKRATKRQLSNRVKIRRKITDILLLTSKKAEFENTAI
jgi:putative sigma-54 modulation protein